MNRNGLVFVPREPTKRVILYPTQDSTSQQQLQQPNGFTNRAKTAIVTINHHHDLPSSSSSSNNNARLSRHAAFSSPPNGIPKIPEKSGNEGTISNGLGQTTSVNGVLKVSNSYQVNPFFRAKVVTNQPQSTTAAITTSTTNAGLPSPSNRDSSITMTNVALQTLTSGSTTIATRGRPSIALKTQNPLISSNGRTQEPEITVETAPINEDKSRWAHNVASASIARRATSDERSIIASKTSETNMLNSVNNDLTKSKGASATDIVISLMDTWRAPINPTGSSPINVFTRANIIRDDSTISGQTLSSGEQVPSTPPFLTVGVSSAASNNNQNWKKALVANFQKNSRSNPTAKLFISKQTVVASQPPTTMNNDTVAIQQVKPERTMILNGLYNERTFQVTENTPIIPSLIRKSTESLRVAKQDNNTNSNIERASSLQVPSVAYTNPVTPTVTINKMEEIVQLTEVSNPESTAHIPIAIPTALITAKPPANVEQQRAIITRVMIRRDFVKSTESKPAMPTAANFRSLIPPQSAKPGGLPINNVVQTANVIENNNIPTSTVTPNRIYSAQQSQSQQHYYYHHHHQQQQQQQQVPLSQKSLLSYTSANPAVKDLIKMENNQQPVNSLTSDSFTSSSIMKTQQVQPTTNMGAVIRSNSLSAANAESKRKREELVSKMKKRATSASAVPNDG